ncbi:putative neural-cadherin 2 [Homalodisca vitripennis]|uniref:putative neural-cadherin 2 n=1 Tax=Homalodisca vitripennis TaxID=197043 RepID=UPI001EEB6312|nr:putative neural-cadherin 2 [Homalodisca vitripennis]
MTGCLDDIRLDGRLLPLPPGTNGSQWGQASVTRGLQRNCHSRNVCADVKCPDTFLCQDIWNDHICSCGDGKVSTSRGCEDRDECLDNPCLNGGFCVNQESRIRYRCECPEGFWGQKCELAQERQSMRLGFGALFTICYTIFSVLVALVVAYNRRREAPTMKKPGPDDDVRENIISYNDEGGGEDDLNAFDLLPLKVPVKGLSSENKKQQVPELVEGTGLEARIEGRRKRADLEHTAPPYDDLRNYAFEGNCDSVVGSLSSLESCSDADDAVRYVVLGPRFARLVDIYSAHLEMSDDSTLEATV